MLLLRDNLSPIFSVRRIFFVTSRGVTQIVETQPWADGRERIGRGAAENGVRVRAVASRTPVSEEVGVPDRGGAPVGKQQLSPTDVRGVFGE